MELHVFVGHARGVELRHTVQDQEVTSWEAPAQLVQGGRDQGLDAVVAETGNAAQDDFHKKLVG